ncbi:methyltransferase [Aurantimonas sp. A2-1-M11]|uniref:methyltransferase n=1 Tax=Aurantimonas sp. A2-1-M11 TaxID=3113712 RepID=UPI002F91F754
MNSPEPGSAGAADDGGEPAVRCDGFYGGRFALLQPQGRGYRSGLDALLLAATLPQGAGGRVADIGSGAGAVGLAAACRSAAAEVTLVENSKVMADLARRSLVLPANRELAARVRVAEVDILAGRAAREGAGLADGAFAHVLTNPPFHPCDHRVSPDPLRAAAMSAADGDFLGRWVRACAALLAHGGHFATIVRTDALPTLLTACEGRIGALRIVAIHSRDAAPAPRLVVLGRKGSRAPLAVLPAHTLHRPAGGLTDFAITIAEGTGDLGL